MKQVLPKLSCKQKGITYYYVKEFKPFTLFGIQTSSVFIITWVLDYGKIERYCGIKRFLLLLNIILFSFSPKTFDFLFQKHSIFYSEKKIFFENSCSRLYYFFQVSAFTDCHLFRNYLQSEKKRGFFWPKNCNFLKNVQKKSCSLKIAILEFPK